MFGASNPLWEYLLFPLAFIGFGAWIMYVALPFIKRYEANHPELDQMNEYENRRGLYAVPDSEAKTSSL